MAPDSSPAPTTALWRPLVRTLLAVVLAWGAAAVVGWVALGTVPGQYLDERALRGGQALTFLGPRTRQVLDTLPAVGAAVGGLALVVMSVRARSLRAAVVGLGVALGATVSVQVLKRLVIDKPDLNVQAAALNSFPSGHTTMAAVAGMVLVLAIPAGARARVGLLAALYTALAGASTVVNGWHRPSDVVAAVFITAGWAMIGSLVLHTTTGPEQPRASGTGETSAVALGLVAGGACVLLAGAAAVPTLAGVGLAWGLVSGMATVLGACLLSYATLAALARHR
ncbi:PAP2 superfamily protein [Raineyella antarctica]|uniref:PAP2 superfamily protein n=1 Tax=Raineyella antarctica TaxID=1577474 RepID=A0A1G6GSY6_9ACTN|nr:phosphatase PAP2 family protein [Raineyella antarctica]SDB84286.1 PAP2 superfamily protein [Raineyella antarctica]